MFLFRQYLTFPLRVNVNLKAVTVEDLIARRKVRRILTEQIICLKDEKTLLIESEQVVFNHRPQKGGTATAAQSFHLNVGVEGLLK
jgi:hypothetical protein